MASAKVTMKSSGVEALLKSGEVASMLRGKAEAVLSAAQASAPRLTGAYADSLQVVEDQTDRAVARVVTTAPHGFIVEANTGNLARALDAAG